ncbi:peptidoglycan-binding protein [Actinacidiphila oryziradicis]|nr:peptidoglycan-binding protein [Actinacidiphila oryziradicis]
MSTPVFVEFEPLPGCVCEDCARRRLTQLAARSPGGCRVPPPAAARVLVVAAAGAVATAAAVPAAAEARAPAPHQSSRPMVLTPSQILGRARTWVDAGVPYSMGKRWRDGYRQDCSGFVSMAWGLGSNQWTGSLPEYGERIHSSELMPGDILLYHNHANPIHGSHVVIFGGWADSSHSRYIAYEQTKPRARIRTIPYPYWSNSSQYVPYRYRYVRDGSVPDPGGSDISDTSDDSDDSDGSNGNRPGGGEYPGSASFGPGAFNDHITQLGSMLMRSGGRPYYRSGPGPRWGEADRRAVVAFQRAQGWSGEEADGIPGPGTWRLLLHGGGRDARAGGGTGSRSADTPAPPYPGAARFRPGQSGDAVLALGRQLVAKGFDKHYDEGPGPAWGEADRRAVEAFQRAQGWSGDDADGYPGPETWRRLFS